MPDGELGPPILVKCQPRCLSYSCNYLCVRLISVCRLCWKVGGVPLRTTFVNFIEQNMGTTVHRSYMYVAISFSVLQPAFLTFLLPVLYEPDFTDFYPRKHQITERYILGMCQTSCII